MLSWESTQDACFRSQPQGSEGAEAPGDSGVPDVPSCPQLRR